MKLQERMFALMGQWQKSDLLKREFLKRTGVGSSKFDYWHKKYNDSKKDNPIAIGSERDSVRKHSDKINTDFQELKLPKKSTQDLTKIIELTTQSGLTVKIFEKC